MTSTSLIALIAAAVALAGLPICVIGLAVHLKLQQTPGPADFVPVWTPLDARRHRRAIRQAGLEGFDDQVELRVSRHHIVPGPRNLPTGPWVHVGLFNRVTGGYVGGIGVGSSVDAAAANLVDRVDPRFFDKYRRHS